MAERLKTGATVPDFTFDTPWKKGLALSDFTKKGTVVLMFLRYMGCPICQMKIAELRRDFDEFAKRKVYLLVVLQSEPASITRLVDKKDIPFEIVCDPKGKLFALYAVRPGTIFGYVTPATIAAVIRSMRRGFRHGKYEGNEMQLPAVFVVGADKKIRFAYYGRNVADVPETKRLLEVIDGR
jgi:peroxiredoxin